MATKLSQRFYELRDEIRGAEPTVLLARDWCETLATLCEDLALATEMAQASAGRAANIASCLANGIKPD